MWGSKRLEVFVEKVDRGALSVLGPHPVPNPPFTLPPSSLCALPFASQQMLQRTHMQEVRQPTQPDSCTVQTLLHKLNRRKAGDQR